MDWGGHVAADRAALVDRLADHVHDPAERLRADWHADFGAGRANFLTPGEAIRGIHRDRPNNVLAEVLGDLQHEAVAAIVGLERREDRRKLALEGDVNHGADHLADATGDIA